MGVTDAVVNAGGEVHAYGRHGDRPWRIGIRDPRGPGVIAYVDIVGEESVVTSGDYEHYFEYQGRRYCHIIDPRTGYPAEGVRSVTVIHPSAGVGEAACKAFFLAKPKEWALLRQHMSVEQVMMIDDEGVVHLTPALAKRLHFVLQPPPKIVIEGTDPVHPAEVR
jgi:thiamine biosynthesis lipoprotein